MSHQTLQTGVQSLRIASGRAGKPFSLPSGAAGFTNDSGQWVCTGSQMGRRNVLPEDCNLQCELRLIRLPFVDQRYDRWGAYWGSPANIWTSCRVKRGWTIEEASTLPTQTKISLYRRTGASPEPSKA